MVQGHGRLHAKGSVYEGGVAVPMIISGRGVTRAGERENALVSSVDLFATIADLAGTDTAEFNDSKSFAALLGSTGDGPRQYAYTEVKVDDRDDWALRSSRYKLVQRLPASEELYDLEMDPFERENLIANGSDVATILAELRAQAGLIRQ